VLSGGTADPMGAEPWVLKMQNFLRTTVAEHPSQKLVGICWGHQTMCVALGGIVGNMDGPEIGVTDVELTAEGRKIIPHTSSGRLQIPEFHRHDIKISAKGFLPLSEKNQAFLNENNTILTFQGHLEMNAGLAKQMLESAPGYMGVQGAKKDALAQRMESHHEEQTFGREYWHGLDSDELRKRLAN
jgi:GMP synthase-like glutamine amidotransferase